MTVYEDFVTEKVLAGQSIIGLYPLTSEKHKKDFEERKKMVEKG